MSSSGKAILDKSPISDVVPYVMESEGFLGLWITLPSEYDSERGRAEQLYLRLNLNH
jgi:hypothetical protein